jgi:hypothetical protein
MKKLIVLSVIFALVAGSVFAADVSVDVHGGAQLLNGSTKETLTDTKDDGTPVYETGDPGTAFGIGRVRISASGGTEDGTLGGWLRFNSAFQGDVYYKDKDKGLSNFGLSYVTPSGFVWWKPIDQLKVQIGQNPDGEFGLDGVTRWGFYQLAGDIGVASEGWAFGGAFFGGYGGSGLILNITPAEAFAINIGIPLGDVAEDSYKKFTAQAVFNIDGVGKAGLTYIGSLMKDEAVLGIPYISTYKADKPETWSFSVDNNDNPTMYVYFGLTAIENLGIDFGIGYQFGDKYVDEVKDGSNTTTTTTTLNNPLAVGVGAHFTSGAFGIKARVMGKFAGSNEFEQKATGSDTLSLKLGTGTDVVFDIQPYFAINDQMTFYFSAGINLHTGEEAIDWVETLKAADGKYKTKEAEPQLSWHVNPYICITPSYWSGSFFAGIRISHGASDKYTKFDKEGASSEYDFINWSIPIGITISF